MGSIIGQQLIAWVFAGVLGLAVGALFSERLKRVRKIIWICLTIAFLLFALGAPFPLNGVLTLPVTFVIFCIGVSFGLAWGRIAKASADRITFGSAKWATAALLQQRGMIGQEGLALGYFADRNTPLPMHYTGDRHLLTVAPTRAGKGVAAIIPNLLTYRGSALVVDPKGENAMVTALRRGQGDAEYRIEGMGQAVHVVDPWNLTSHVTGLAPSCFNPLDWLDPASLDIGENAMMLADALVVSSGEADAFWNEEAKAVIMGFILHVATSPSEAGDRTLGRVRDILLLPAKELEAVLIDMLASNNDIVASSAGRLHSKEEKLKANVLSTAQAQTHFLDSPRLRESLSRSDFQFEDLKDRPTTVYLVLPADRLQPFGRWLRLMIQQAITVTARNITDRPERPILFMLDEMAALGRLAMLEQAYGLMAGFGMQLWGVVQDLSQLHRIYGDGWQTFIGNSGVLQYFGSRDKMTAEYFSALCGQQTIPTLSSTFTRNFSGQGGGSSTSHAYGETSRSLIFPDELMRVASHIELVLIENLDPVIGQKISWHQDPRFKPLGVNLRSPPPVVAPPPAVTAESA